MYELTITDHFSSAHYLREYDGPCENLHGHTWKLEISLVSDTLNELGLVIDFRIIKERLKAFLKDLDHVCLNDLEAFKDRNPSTENLAQFIYDEFSKKCEGFRLTKVRVWESETSSVTFSPD